MNIYAVILAAGKGTRMKSDKPKVLHEVLYKPMVLHVVDVLKKVGVSEIVAVVGHGAEEVEAVLAGQDVQFALQAEQLGTGHAVLQAADLLEGKEGLTLVLNGDAPLIQASTLKALIQTHIDNGHQATMMTCDLPETTPFGRIIRDASGQVKCITEYKDATAEERKITEMNAGEYCFDNKYLFEALRKLTPNNAQHEYYITDLAKIMGDMGLKVGTHIIDDFNEVGGINDRVSLAEANETLKLRVNREHLLNGVTMIDPKTTYIGTDVVIGADTVIEPGCILKGQTVIGKNCHIGPYSELTNVVLKDNVEIKYSVLSDSVVESGTDIGPFARLRTNCHILENVHIGNFVEMKKTEFGVGSKCAHLSYIGDATVGKGVNIGCGTITSNYDGANKFQTIIKDNAFIGCNSNLVAPVTVGEGGFVGAGSTVTDDVPADAFAVARARQVNKDGYAKVLEEKRMKIKNAKKK